MAHASISAQQSMQIKKPSWCLFYTEAWPYHVAGCGDGPLAVCRLFPHTRVQAVTGGNITGAATALAAAAATGGQAAQAMADAIANAFAGKLKLTCCCLRALHLHTKQQQSACCGTEVEMYWKKYLYGTAHPHTTADPL